MINIYCPRKSTGLNRLVQAIKELGGEAQIVTERNAVAALSWGFSNPNAGLNSRIVGNKFVELQRLAAGNVPVPQATRSVPDTRAPWLERKFNHRAGRDLKIFEKRGYLNKPDYWVNRIKDVIKEFRVHVFKGKVIRAGLKVKNTAATEVHPWIRTHTCGWVLDYGKKCQEFITKEIRFAAKKAILALKYDFGAVDIALRSDGSLIVFEVNAAPGLDNYKTALKYGKHILDHANGI